MSNKTKYSSGLVHAVFHINLQPTVCPEYNIPDKSGIIKGVQREGVQGIHRAWQTKMWLLKNTFWSNNETI